MPKIKILVFTGNRAEYGLQYPIIKSLNNSQKIDCQLVVSGSHLEKKFGETFLQIKKDKFKIASKIKLIDKYNSRLKTPNLIGQAICKISKSLYELKPDIFLVNADRFETFAAAIASSQLGIPTFHVEGGDITEGGALDDNIRHAISKLSHIHFVTNKLSYHNLILQGEEKRRVYNVGLPINDTIYNSKFLSLNHLKSKFNLDQKKALLILTYHPVTTQPELAQKQIQTVLKSISYFIKKYDFRVIATYPNNDVGSNIIINELKNFVNKNKNFSLHKSLGSYVYHSLMNLSQKMNIIIIGNSSSGIKEAVAFKCPVVNIGSRQNGRLKPKNVFDVNCERSKIIKKIQQIAFARDLKIKLSKVKNPYYQKNTGKRITKIIENLILDDKIIRKKYNFK